MSVTNRIRLATDCLVLTKELKIEDKNQLLTKYRSRSYLKNDGKWKLGISITLYMFSIGNIYIQIYVYESDELVIDALFFSSGLKI